MLINKIIKICLKSRSTLLQEYLYTSHNIHFFLIYIKNTMGETQTSVIKAVDLQYPFETLQIKT